MNDGQVHYLERTDADYPVRLRQRLGSEAPRVLSLHGDPSLLRLPVQALFCSVQLPPELLLPAFDLARRLRDAAVPVIGGFQSPVERQCLEYLLRGSQPVIAAPARGLEGMRLPATWQEALKEGRLLLVSPLPARHRRPTRALAVTRNRVVAALSHGVFMVHAAPGGRLQALAAEVLSWKMPLHCFAHPHNHDLVLWGAQAEPSADFSDSGEKPTTPAPAEVIIPEAHADR